MCVRICLIKCSRAPEPGTRIPKALSVSPVCPCPALPATLQQHTRETVRFSYRIWKAGSPECWRHIADSSPSESLTPRGGPQSCVLTLASCDSSVARSSGFQGETAFLNQSVSQQISLRLNYDCLQIFMCPRAAWDASYNVNSWAPLYSPRHSSFQGSLYPEFLANTL